LWFIGRSVGSMLDKLVYITCRPWSATPPTAGRRHCWTDLPLMPSRFALRLPVAEGPFRSASIPQAGLVSVWFSSALCCDPHTGVPLHWSIVDRPWRRHRADSACGAPMVALVRKSDSRSGSARRRASARRPANPMGRPADLKPHGTLAAGCCVMLNG
jgi:hypothetical protein